MIRIEIEDSNFIEFDEQSITYFYGENQKLRSNLIRSLKRFAMKKPLNALEEIVYGENGIEIYRDETALSAKKIDFYFLQDSFSLYQAVKMDKESLMRQYLGQMDEEVLVHQKLEEIKDKLLEMELIFNQHLAKISDNISVNLTELSFEQLLKNHLFLSYFDSKQDFPLEMMDGNELIDEFVALLGENLRNIVKESWIVLVNPESFLTSSKVDELLDSLLKLAKDYPFLKILVIAEHAIEREYHFSDLSSTNILSDSGFLPMPEFELFRKSVERYYPEELKMSNEELLRRFFEIVSFVATNRVVDGLSAKNMVLLKVLDKMLNVSIKNQSYDIETLSEIERSFLADGC